MNPQQQPLPHQPQPPRQSTIDIGINGDISFSGEMTAETQQIIEQALQQAEYYKARAASLEEKKVQKMAEVDAVVVAGAALVMVLLMFFTFVTVSSIVSIFRPVTESSIGVSTNV